MKRNKLLNFMVLAFLLMFVDLVCINALPDTIGPMIQPSTGDTLTDTGCSSSSCYGVPLKVYKSSDGDIPVICTDYDKKSPANDPTLTCTKIVSNTTEYSVWNDAVRYAVASIISTANSTSDYISNSTVTDNYFAAELAINHFLNYVYNNGDSNGSKADGRYIYASSLTSRFQSKFNSYVQTAKDAYQNFNSNVSISLSTSSLTFTLNGDNYESNNITVSGVNDFEVTTNIGKISRNGSSFKVIISTNNINTTTQINVTVSSSKTVNLASNYYCASYQTVTPVQLEPKTYSASKDITGTITIEEPKGTLIIKKYDNNNKYLSGATLVVTGPNNYRKTITTAGNAITLSDLTYGTYTITETKAPSGYSKAAPQTVTLSSNNEEVTITMIDKPTKVKVSKTDITGQNELEGATLEIQDANGNVVNYCNGKACKWVSKSTPHEIEGMPIGTYYLVETIAPSGYTLNTSKVEFTIKDDGTVVPVKMTNELNGIKISKIDDTTNNVLAGATLEIQDKNGNVVNYCNGKACKWVSKNTPYEIAGFPTGTYYLVETKAPEGYALNTKKVEFTVKDTDTTINVVIKNTKNKIKISKIDDTTNKALAGATLEIQDKNGNVVNYCNGKACKWVSKNTPHEIAGFPTGTYYLVETKAPEGYTLNTSKVEFTVKDTDTTINVVIKNTKNKIKISKINSSTNKVLEGAILEIQDENGNIVKYCTDKDGGNAECKWTSTSQPYEIVGMPFGTYYLVETNAPEGFVINTEKVKFVVTQDDTAKMVKMKNEPTRVTITKVNSVDGRALAGATLEIQDEDGNIVKYCTDKDGNNNVECKWISTEQPFEIEEMPFGTYYLVETKAPEGYELNKEKIKFEVINDSDDIEVEMKNELGVPVPDTLSRRSALLISVSMFVIAFGIGIITFVKKNKTKYN